jgi:LysM repeat protein
MKKVLFASKSLAVLGLLLWPVSGMAGGASGALTLLENSDAKYAALGEAATAAKDDIAVMNYNPAGLKTLSSGQASFLYQKGLTEDAYGRFMIGAPAGHGAMGLSIGYYNAGTLETFDGTQTREITAQQDFAIGVGMAHTFGGLNAGMNLKYLHSTLAETYTANVAAVDFGLQSAVTSRLSVGAAFQNLGNGIKYASEADPLPTNYRLGMAYALTQGHTATTLLMDIPYFTNERETRPSIGLDVALGLLSLRAGVRDNGSKNEFSVGAGFMMGRSSLDYAFGMANQLDSTHRVSLNMKFGGAATPAFVKKPATTPTVVAMPAEAVRRHTLGGEVVTRQAERQPVQYQRHVYVVKRGDTLASISKETYGTSANWKSIYAANKHLLDDPTKIEAGQKIVLP